MVQIVRLVQVHEYVKILDQSTGTIRVESGSQGASKQVFLGPHDKVLDNGKKKAQGVLVLGMVSLVIGYFS